MRTAYHEQLDALTAQLGEMCAMAGVAMEHATRALLQADLGLAEQVMSDHDQITALSVRAEEAAFMLLALQAPVAGDLRAAAHRKGKASGICGSSRRTRALAPAAHSPARLPGRKGRHCNSRFLASATRSALLQSVFLHARLR